MSTVVIDAGHGGEDIKGAVFEAAHEDEINLNIAYFVDFYLTMGGHSVVLTRDTDVYVSLFSRVQITERQNADAFVTIHCNSDKDTTQQGMELCIGKTPSLGDLHLAWHIEKTMLMMFPDRRHWGIKNSQYYIDKISRPAVMIRTGFLTNTPDRHFLIKVENQKRLGKCIAEGIMRYLLFMGGKYRW